MAMKTEQTTAVVEGPENGVEELVRGLPLLLGMRELIFNLSMGGRTIERLIATGGFPAPDVALAGKRLWHRGSIRKWLG
ncbi:MAG TPA: hypothetical protein VGR35_11715 [Tepidisphaeraceae bacterium]|nr:hypothetical protein [Tepidisphaeraceae bacterium]